MARRRDGGAFVPLGIASLGLLLAGCVETASQDEDGLVPHATPWGPSFTEPTWSGCDVLITGAFYPSGTVEARRDPHWPAEDEELTHIRLHGLDCQQIAWGAFHGPARMLFEWGGEVAAPPDCQHDYEAGTLQSVWVDDAGLAETLSSAFEGLPVRLGDMQATASPATYRWEWSAPGQEPSWIEVASDPLPQDPPLPGELRLYWFNETGVSFLEFEDDRTRAFNPSITGSWGNRLAAGELRPPMVGSSVGGYAALGERSRAESLQGYVTRFADHFCTTEV